MSITNLKEAKKAKPDYLDFDNDGNTKESMKNALRDKAKQKVEEAKKVKPKRWWDDDGDGIGWEPGEVDGKFKRKKKMVKEGYSNWREDLSEVIKMINKDKNDKQIKERKVKNKIEINPRISEAVDNLGGTLLEFSETEDICILEDLKKLEILTLDDELLEEVVYEFFIESLEEGYTVDEIEFCILESIENSLSYLTEEEDSKKRGILSRIKGFVKGAAKKLAKGAGYVAGLGVRAVKGTAREVRRGYARGRSGARDEDDEDDEDTHSSSSSRSRVTRSSSSRGQSEPRRRVQVTSSSSERPSTETRARTTARDGVRRGLRRTLSNWAYNAGHKLDPDTGKPSAAHTKGPKSQKLRSGIGGGKRIEVAGRGKESEPEVKKVSVREVPQKPSEVHSRQGTRKPSTYSAAYKTAKVKTTPRLPGSSGESTSEKTPPSTTPPSTPRRRGRRPKSQTRTTKVSPTQASTSERVKTSKTTSSTEDKLSDLPPSIRGAAIKFAKKNQNENYQLTEKSLSVSQQQAAGAALAAKRGEISPSELKGASLDMYNSMSEKQLRDFAKTKHKGLPEKKTKSEAVKEELIARMEAKIAEQAPEVQQKVTKSSKNRSEIQHTAPQNTSIINSLLTAKGKADRAQADVATRLKVAAAKKVNLSSLTTG